MTAAFRSASTNFNTGATSIVMDAPAGLASGDFMFWISAWRASMSLPIFPSGWTSDLSIALNSYSTLYQMRAWKIAGGSEPSTYTLSWTTSRPVASIMATYSGVTFPVGGATFMESTVLNNVTSASMIVGAHAYEKICSPKIIRVYSAGVLNTLNTLAMTPPGTVTGRAEVNSGAAGVSVWMGDEFDTVDYIWPARTFGCNQNGDGTNLASQMFKAEECHVVDTFPSLEFDTADSSDNPANDYIFSLLTESKRTILIEQKGL